MVFKVSKGGVRSGNTLRGLSTLNARRYANQACIVGRSSLPARDVKKLFEETTDDDLIYSSLKSTDVILSLNKKQRWRLPSTLSHMIKTGSFSDQKTMISLLECHKLKRRANCISLVCNKGRFSQIIPKQKRYFSFNLETIDEDNSNRQRRRRIAELKKKEAIFKVKKDKRTDMVTTQVFTVEGVNHKKEAPILNSSKPEYRLEVFYPCPKSCSLTFNPKYTDVVLEMGKEGKMEVKSNTRSAKSQKRKHRKRYINKDLDYFKLEVNDSSTEDMWSDEENAQSDQSYSQDKRNIKDDPLTEECEASLSAYDYGEHERKANEFSESIFSNLIAQAEKAKSLCEFSRRRRQRKSSQNKQSLEMSTSDKSHIVYIKDITPEITILQKSQPLLTPVTISEINLHWARVILSSVETSPYELREKFGHLYSEAESEPRRFVINVTDDIHNLLSMSRNAEKSAVFTSFIVFIHDGCYDDGLDAFKVCFNSNICTNTDPVCKAIPFEKTSVDEIMNRIVCAILDMKQENMLNQLESAHSDHCLPSSFDIINQVLKVKVESFQTSNEIIRVAQMGKLQEKTDFSTSFNRFHEHLDMDMFCGICYENVNPTHLDSKSGTQLTECGHQFCDECWKSHFHTKSKDGAVKMVCPSYQCDVTVGPVTLLSLLHVSEVGQLWQRLREEEIEVSENIRWCPNPQCGRVIKLDLDKSRAKSSRDVVCACGTEVCFSCLSSAHWPAKCRQAEEYLEKLPKLKPPMESTDESPSQKLPVLPKPKKTTVVEVIGKMCPKCLRFIDKNGGCPHMSCRCGHQFCWTCLKPFTSHTECKVDPYFVYKYSRRINVHHIQLSEQHSLDATTSDAKVKKPISARKKITMYQKALQQRLEAKDSGFSKQIKELAKKMSHVAQKDLDLKRKFFSLFGVDTTDLDEGSLTRLILHPHAVKYFRSYFEIKRALHHVAEFTFVLLQDTSNSLEKRKALTLANDLSGYCSFIKSILELGSNQDIETAVKRLEDIQTWAIRALTALLSTVHQKVEINNQVICD